jgi:large subunit ribosomal protein L17
MRHLKKSRKLSRIRKQRQALLKTMLGDFFLREKIKTTEAKAKELRKKAEKIIARSRKMSEKPGGVNLARLRFLRFQLPRSVKPETLKKIARMFPNRQSGFTRIVKIGQRRSDGAKMAVIELVKEGTYAGKTPQS